MIEIPNYLCEYNFIQQNIHEFVLNQDNWLYPEFILMESIRDPLKIILKIEIKKNIIRKKK